MFKTLEIHQRPGRLQADSQFKGRGFIRRHFTGALLVFGLLNPCLRYEVQASAPVPPRRTVARMLPAAAHNNFKGHPEAVRMRAFLKNQDSCRNFRATGLDNADYLRVIAGQVAAFRPHQDTNGAIIDPLAGIEWQYSTPCYALSVALLHATGFDASPELLVSGVRAMDSSVNQISTYRCAHNHGEFYLQPVMLALDLFVPAVGMEKVTEWESKLATADPYKLHPDNLTRKTTVYNHNVVALAGEILRIKHGIMPESDFFERHMENQKQYLAANGMYMDPKVPMVYDEFSRQFLASILVEGYAGPSLDFYKDRLWRGAWMSLFMQSPHGECPTGGRSAQHIWNEAQMAVTYEIYAAQHALASAAGSMAIAGAFKRAAHLSLQSIQRWLKPDGSGYVVKNRFPPEARHGFERYSAQSQYNLLACWLLGVAYLYSHDGIPERPAPADVGGFALPIVPDFHKVFANAGGTYVEYETAGDLRYNPTGLIRIHFPTGNPQLGPSDGVVHKFDPNTKQDLGGENVAVGPAWQDAKGNWHRLADYSTQQPPQVVAFEESPQRTSFRVSYTGDFDGASRITQEITLTPGKVTVRDRVVGAKAIRIYYPMLVFDGQEQTAVSLAQNKAALRLRDGAAEFRLEHPRSTVLQRAGQRLDYRNGQAEPLFADVASDKAEYSIRLVPFN